MIFFTDNVIYVVSEETEGNDIIVPEDIEGIDSSVLEDIDGKDTSVPEEIEGKDTSVFDESSATGETQQSSIPTIINDIVVPDNSYSKYCFFFLMLLFALFVGRSFRKGI